MNRNTGVIFVFLLLGICFVLPADFLAAQDDDGGRLSRNLHRIDYRDLGFWPRNIIAADNSKITSLITDPRTGLIFGATSGKAANLFCFDPSHDHVRPLGYLPAANGVRSALVLGADGMLYIGTGKDMMLEADLSSDWGSELGRDHIFLKMWADLEAEYEGYAGGRIYRFDPAGWQQVQYAAGSEAEVEDLGVPVVGDGVYCMIGARDGNALYGITYPHGHFFVRDLESGETRDLGPVWESVVYAGPKKGERTLPGQLILDEAGNCYFSVERGRLARYCPETGQIERLQAELPGEYFINHSDGVFHPVVESWTAAPDGSLYGGTNDGFLFRFLPDEMRLLNLGKVRVTRRVRTLTAGDDGRVWGIAGEDHIGCTLFCYDPEQSVFEHYGPIVVDRSPYYAWYPQRFAASTTGLDGTIYLGESDRRGHLYLVLPPAGKRGLKDTAPVHTD